MERDLSARRRDVQQRWYSSTPIDPCANRYPFLFLRQKNERKIVEPVVLHLGVQHWPGIHPHDPQPDQVSICHHPKFAGADMFLLRFLLPRVLLSASPSAPG